jgi:hypothetical protein|nr:MAG TPA: ABC-type bacteriocin transporter [Caudoviricetes sp.]
MNNKKYKIFVAIVIVIILCLGVYFGLSTRITETTQGNTAENNVQTYEMTNEDIEALSTTEITEQTEAEEEEIGKEQEVENEEFELQGQIAYEGSSQYPQVSLGSYSGLTYYSQIDSRWKNHMYSSVSDSSQTIGTSGCGPTSAAMVVTAIKGTITPPEMADLFVNNGYRSASNGTYLSAFRWVADVFDIGYQETYSLDTAVDLLKDNNYLIVSCGNGLFTTGGHLMVITGIDRDTLRIYDPYLYSGKFDTSTRRGKVTVSGNTVYCSVDNFRRYANYTRFFAYKHDGNVQENTGNVTTSTYTRYVKTSTGVGVNVRSGPGTGYGKVGALADGTSVIVYETSGNWSRIGTNRWVSSDYLVSTYTNSNVYNTIGQIRKIKACYLYSKSNLSGTKYTYKANTTVTILENISSNVDKVRVNVTGRIAYINTSNYTSSTSISVKNTVGQYKRLKAKTYLYSKSNLTGTKYTYLPLTQVKIIKNVSSTVDYVYVVKTGRYAYVKNNVYK